VTFSLWYLIVGVLLVLMALTSSVLKRLPLTAAMFYLAAGLLLGPGAAGLLRIDVIRDAHLLERFTEVAVVISLFSAGLKLRLPLRDRRWLPPILLAAAGIVVTVGLATVAGIGGLNLSLGAAVLLAAVVAPTDPVLASDVQVEHAADDERLRFTLTGEAGLNDGTAFPFVMLGLGILGAHELGSNAVRWIAVDVLWAVTAGLAFGTLCGSATGRLVVYLRREHREAVGTDDFLALGLIALAYGGALLIHSYGFLSVFAAGLALRRVEREHTGTDTAPDVKAAAHASEDKDATDPDKAPAYMAQAVLGFNEQLERLGEVAVVLVLGGLLSQVTWTASACLFIAALFLIVRPLATFLSLAGSELSIKQRAFVGWFGVRGVGSVYYLAFALTHGTPAAEARVLADITLIAVAASIVVHGISVTPLMRYYVRTA
jgi:sodium/hydrogen antiporter